MSQNSRALKLIEKEASLIGFLLRPLSAKLLKPTIPEEKGFVKRESLFAISGRSRKKQMALARFWQIQNYPSPAGGCLLTDQVFGQKLKELLEVCPKCAEKDVMLLRYGRHFWFDGIKIIIGRNEAENAEIKKLGQKEDVLIEMENFPGPLTLIRNYSKQDVLPIILNKAKDLTISYSAKARGLTKDVKFTIFRYS